MSVVNLVILLRHVCCDCVAQWYGASVTTRTTTVACSSGSCRTRAVHSVRPTGTCSASANECCHSASILYSRHAVDYVSRERCSVIRLRISCVHFIQTFFFSPETRVSHHIFCRSNLYQNYSSSSVITS